MDLLETLGLNCIFLAFPILVYLLHLIYTKNTNTKEKNIFLDLALLLSIFLIIKSYKKSIFIYQLLLINIPLIIAYLKKRKILIVGISLILILLLYYNYHINIYLLIIEYALYTFIYFKTINRGFDKFLSMFLFIKSFINSLEIFIFINPDASFIYKTYLAFIDVFILNMVTYILLFLMKKTEEIVDLNITLRELEKEKKLRESLFKMTHEIKNPLAVCKGYIDMIRQDKATKEQKDKYINIINDEISRTLLLMDDFLDYSKIKVTKEIIDITLLIDEIVDSLSTILKTKNIKLSKYIPEEDIYINADYNRLKQVIINIIKNAIEAKNGRKNLTIEIRIIKNKNGIRIIISDNGIGMDKKTLGSINNMFYTTKAKGTGLGIPLSNEIINLHGGSIKYHSTPGRGTKVNIILPVGE